MNISKYVTCTYVCEHVYMQGGQSAVSKRMSCLLSWQALSVYQQLCMSDGKHSCHVTSSVLM
jgi:hypothetical protein